MTKTILLIICVTRAYLKSCGKRDAREESNRSAREGRIESRHSTNSLDQRHIT